MVSRASSANKSQSRIMAQTDLTKLSNMCGFRCMSALYRIATQKDEVNFVTKQILNKLMSHHGSIAFHLQ